MARSLEFDREQLGLPFAVYFGVIGIASPLATALILRFGIRATLVIGNSALAVGALLLATVVTDPLLATVCFGGLVGFAVSAGGNLTTQTAIPRWFVRHRARAFAIILTASAAGGVIVTPLLGWIIGPEGDGWRNGWWLLSGLAAGIVMVIILTVRESPADLGQFPDGDTHPPERLQTAEADNGASPAGSWIDVLSAKMFWVVAFGSFALTAALSLFLAHGAANAADQGYSQTEIAFVLAGYALIGFLAKVVIAIYGDRWNPATMWALLFVISAAALAVAAISLEGAGIYLYMTFAGIGLGAGLVCPPATAARHFEGPMFARVTSGIFLLQSIAGVSTPLIAGAWFNASGSYFGAFLATAVLCLASALVLVATSRKKRAVMVPPNGSSGRGATAAQDCGSAPKRTQ
jgi:MFS family permease